jgi:hypothetical protein
MLACRHSKRTNKGTVNAITTTPFVPAINIWGRREYTL